MMSLMNQKGFAPILILIILATLIGGYVVYQKQIKFTPNSQPNTKSSAPLPFPTPDIKLDPSGKFKIYTNHIDKYSFNFPADWNLTERHQTYISNEPRSYAPDHLDVYFSPQSGNGKDSKSYILINVNKANPRRLDEINKAAKQFLQDYKSSPKKLAVSGQNAIQSSVGAGEVVQAGVDTRFRYGIDKYQISIYEVDQGYINKNIDVYNQLLGSFKFTDPPSTAVSNTLKTYENKDLGISFQIPGDWLVEKYTTSQGLFMYVYDENDRPIIAMYTGGHTYNDACEKDPSKKTYKPYPLGDKTVNLDMTYACAPRVIRVRTSTGKEFNFEYQFPDIGQTDKEKDMQFLKTIKGLDVI